MELRVAFVGERVVGEPLGLAPHLTEVQTLEVSSSGFLQPERMEGTVCWKGMNELEAKGTKLTNFLKKHGKKRWPSTISRKMVLVNCVS